MFSTESTFSTIAVVPAGGHRIETPAAFVPPPFDDLPSRRVNRRPVCKQLRSCRTNIETHERVVE